MSERAELESLLRSPATRVDRLLAAIARRHGLMRDAEDAFVAWAKERLAADSALVARFRGESSATTYLAVVIAMLFRDYRLATWGRWRPTAAARRQGELAIRLETLVRRDGLSVTQAGERLRTQGATTLDDAALAELLARLPTRATVAAANASGCAVDSSAVAHTDDARTMRDSGATELALHQALGALGDEDRLLIRLRYLEDMSVADIARGLALPQKPLYRRIDRALVALRTVLERGGISRQQVRALAGNYLR
jgi:RNA polymerase sigma factor (sigma-70 family)